MAAGWLTALALVWVLGDQRALRRTRRQLEAYTPEDLRWLRGRPAPQGRFNAGQKPHAIVQAALAALFVLSGALLWLGERAAPFRLPGTVALHDGAMVVAVALVLGHVFLSVVWPATRPALRGIVVGDVRADWAARHHAAWRPSARADRPERPDRRRMLVGLGVVLAGALATVLLVRSSLVPAGPTAAPATSAQAAAPPLRPGADTLAIEAAQALQEGDPQQAVALLGQAVRQEPRRAALREQLGEAQATAGDVAGAKRTLASAVALAPRAADAHLLLGVVRVQTGERAAGRAELRAYLRLAPRGSGAATARRLLR